MNVAPAAHPADELRTREEPEPFHALVAPMLAAFRRLVDNAEAIDREGPRPRQGIYEFIDLMTRHRRAAAWPADHGGSATRRHHAAEVSSLRRRFEQILAAPSLSAVDQVWAAAIPQGLTSAAVRGAALPDHELRSQLDLIGNTLLRAHTRQHLAPNRR